MRRFTTKGKLFSFTPILLIALLMVNVATVTTCGVIEKGEVTGDSASKVVAQQPQEQPQQPTPQPQQPQQVKPTEQWVSLGTYTLTAYCPCSRCCGKSDGITATGTKATAGRTIAVDPKVIPYGSKVKINGHVYTAEDCGGAIKSKKIDIFFNSHQSALNFGKQTAEVFILKK